MNDKDRQLLRDIESWTGHRQPIKPPPGPVQGMMILLLFVGFWVVLCLLHFHLQRPGGERIPKRSGASSGSSVSPSAGSSAVTPSPAPRSTREAGSAGPR